MRLGRFSAFVTLLLLHPIWIWAQGNEVEIIQRWMTAQHLDGTVRVRADDQPVSDVHVEECDHGWKHVLASTLTDSRGHFHLAPTSTGPIHYIKIYAPGFNICEYKVRLSRHAKPELQLSLSVGT